MSYIAGIDIGYSALKVAHGEAGKKPRKITLSANAAPLDETSQALIAPSAKSPRQVVLVDGQEWAAGLTLNELQNTTPEIHDDYSRTGTYRALFHAALARIGRDTIDHVVTGLPVSHYQHPGAREQLEDQLRGKHQITRTKHVTVNRVSVIPQPVGAYMNLISTTHDADLVEHGRVLVIDPGYYSVDWLPMSGLHAQMASAGTSLQAVSQILSTAAHALESEHGPGVRVRDLESALRTERADILHYGKRVPIRPAIDTSAAAVARKALSAMRSSMREQGVAIDLVVVAGGGASFYAPCAQEIFPRSTVSVPRDTVLANALGFYYYGL